MFSDYIDQLVNLIFNQSDNDVNILRIVAIEGLLKNGFLKKHQIETFQSELYNPQDPMFCVMHESEKNLGQISLWEHNQLFLEVLGFNGDQILNRMFIIPSTEEIERSIDEYFDILSSKGNDYFMNDH